MGRRRASDASLTRHKWISFPSVQISEVITKKDGNAELYTAFKIQVKDGPDRWTVLKRYCNFVELHNKLKESFLEESLPALPVNKWSLFDLSLLWNDSHFNESRRISLEQYLQTLLADAQFFQSSEVRAFLEPFDLPELRKKNKSGDKLDVTDNMFLLPPPPACARRIPQIVIITNSKKNKIEKIELKENDENGKITGDSIPIKMRSTSVTRNSPDDVTLPELCHVSYLLNSIKDGLEYFTEMKKELQAISGPRYRLEYLEMKRARIDTTVDTLKNEQQILGQLIKHPDIVSNPDLAAYFNTCSIQISKVIEWYTKTEDSTMEMIYSEINEKQRKHNSVDLTHKIAKFEEEAENLIVEYLEEKNTSETTISKVIDLEKKVEELLKKIQNNADLMLLNRLKNVLKYLKENFGNELPLVGSPPKAVSFGGKNIVERSIEDLD